MIAIGHTSVGIILGVAASEILPVTTPLLAQAILVGAVGITSHYAMDLIPHGHYDFNQQQPTRQQQLFFGLDFILPLVIIASYLLTTHGFDQMSWLIGAGILGAQLPDLLMGLRSRKILPDWAWLRFESRCHSQTHWHNPIDKREATAEGGRRLGLSDAWQAAMLALAVILLLR